MNADRGQDRHERRRRRAVTDGVATALGGGRLRVVGERFGGWRTDLWRVSDGERSLVVKSYRDPDSNTWRREAAGLAAARGTGCPELVALIAEPAVVVMTDLGTGPSLADHLLGADPMAAADGLVARAGALAQAALVDAGQGGGLVEAATLLWCLVSSSMFLPGALDPTAENEDAAKRPGRWTMVLSLLELASRLDGPPALTSYAGELAGELSRRWGPHPLAIAPAFAG